MRKFFAGVVAAALCLCFAVSAFAATGYGSDTTGTVTSYVPLPSTAPSTSQVSRTADTAIKEAVAAGSSSAVVSFRNITTLTAESIQSVAKKAEAAKTQATIHVDAIEGKSVVSRWYIDPAKATDLTGSIDLDVRTDARGIARTENVFNTYFSNKLAIVSLGQQGSYGMTLGLAVKVDLTQLDTSKLVFYSYNKATNTYAQITAPAYFIDSNGYLHFATSVGGDIVITDSALTQK